jgi:hypothetical protein
VKVELKSELQNYEMMNGGSQSGRVVGFDRGDISLAQPPMSLLHLQRISGCDRDKSKRFSSTWRAP